MCELSEHDAAVLNAVLYPHLPLTQTNEDDFQDAEELTEAVKLTKPMEIQAVELAEDGKLDDAIELLNKALAIAPSRASIYNNRAHLYQFKKMFPEALQDLTMAINLASSKEKMTLSKAYCQRGILHKRATNLELAKEDFEIAAKLGNIFAKNQLVEMNPYAALCNQMLRKVMMENL